MNREQQEMTMWREAYMLAISQGASYGDADEAATTAAESFRKRYSPQPAAPAPVWYDEPPFPKDGKSYPCWVDGDAVHADVCWYDGEWRVWIVGSAFHQPIAGRRVCPITKPQEPNT